MSEFIFCFVDESENRKNNYYLVLTAILVLSENLFDLSQEIEQLKNKYNLSNLKNSRNTKRFKHQDKQKITKELASMLNKYDAKIISIVEIPDKLKKNNYNYKRKKLYFDALWLLSERATLYAKKKRKKWILVADNLVYKTEILKKIKKDIRLKIRLEGEAFKTKIGDYLFETPFFVEDDFSNLIQAVDLAALSLNQAIRTYLSKHDFPIKVEELPNYSDYLNKYWCLFDRSPKGEVNGYGIKIWWYNE